MSGGELSWRWLYEVQDAGSLCLVENYPGGDCTRCRMLIVYARETWGKQILNAQPGKKISIRNKNDDECMMLFSFLIWLWKEVFCVDRRDASRRVSLLRSLTTCPKLIREFLVKFWKPQGKKSRLKTQLTWKCMNEKYKLLFYEAKTTFRAHLKVDRVVYRFIIIFLQWLCKWFYSCMNHLQLSSKCFCLEKKKLKYMQEIGACVIWKFMPYLIAFWVSWIKYPFFCMKLIYTFLCSTYQTMKSLYLSLIVKLYSLIMMCNTTSKYKFWQYLIFKHKKLFTIILVIRKWGHEQVFATSFNYNSSKTKR